MATTNGTADRAVKLEDRRKPKLHLLGMKRSGKSSILRTVFHRENAQDTLHLESTKEVVKEPKASIIDFEVWDHPANIETQPESTLRDILSSTGSLIWVVDAQDEYYEVPGLIASTIATFAKLACGDQKPQRLPSHITVEIFMHKTDCVSVDFRPEIFRDIQARVAEELDVWNVGAVRAVCSFHQTSIFDRTIFEAVSKVVQKHIKPVFHATMEALVKSLQANCGLEKAYLFDAQFMFHVVSDTGPGDLRAYETLSDYLEVVRDVDRVYGWRSRDEGAEEPYEEFHMESSVVMEKRGARTLYVKSMNKFLTLACILGPESGADKQVFIEYNVGVFQKGLNEVLDKLRAK